MNSERVNGIEVIRVHYTADPEKQSPEWKAHMQAGYPADKWAREFEMDAHAGLGLSIYGREYRPATHERPLTIDPNLPVLHGWDFGEGWPAHVWCQRTRMNGLRILASLWREHMQLRPFAEETVAFECNVLGGPFPRRDFADPAGNQPKDDGMKSVEVLREFGWAPRWRGSEYTERHEAMSRLLLSSQPDGEPMLLIDPRQNADLCEAFRSRYRREKHGAPAREHPYIDLMNALEYVLVNTKTPPRPRLQARPDLSSINHVSGYGAWGRLPLAQGG